jgi:hypothetical protein
MTISEEIVTQRHTSLGHLPLSGICPRVQISLKALQKVCTRIATAFSGRTEATDAGPFLRS